MAAVYIAGPFRGANAWEIEQNVHRAETIAAKVCHLGALAVCPHTMFRNFQGLLPDELFLDATLELMRRCDAVLMTDDWRKSVGARAEEADALDCCKRVFYDFGDLAVWIKRVNV